jgi:CRP-like cAMP-binding protein
MSDTTRSPNRILSAVPPEHYDQVLAKTERVPLEFGEHIHLADEPIANLYFPESGLVSLVSSTEDSSYIEVGMIGSEGVEGFAAALGATRSTGTTFIQVGGEALKMSAQDFVGFTEAVPAFRRAVLRFIHGLMTQTSLAAACNTFHAADRRLARWLLMTQDRVALDEFPVTQEFLAQMLGVRREAVNKNVGELRHRGLIDYSRGKITILNRQGMEDFTCSCYRTIARSYIDTDD